MRGGTHKNALLRFACRLEMARQMVEDKLGAARAGQQLRVTAAAARKRLGHLAGELQAFADRQQFRG